MIKETKVLPTETPYEEILPLRKTSGLLKLNRNVAFLMLLLVCLASIHNQQLPDGRTVLTAVQSTVDTPWQEDLGKITFVDHLVPETLSVFFSETHPVSLALPCSGSLAHAWEEHAPYVSFDLQEPDVQAVAEGEVMSLSHTADDQLSLRLRHSNGLESVYYHLASVSVQEGDEVRAGQAIGAVAAGHNLVLDVRRNGTSIDPAAYFKP